MSPTVYPGDGPPLAYLVMDAVRRNLRPRSGSGRLAVSVSGGIDSSTVATIARGLDDEIVFVTGYYDYPGCDETDYARLVVDRDRWQLVPIRPRHFVEHFDAVADALAGLRCGPGAVGQYAVAKLLRSLGVDVVLTGEGGDELFGGYARQYAAAGLPLPDGYENYSPPDGYPTSLEEALAVEWDALRNLCAVDERIAGAFEIEVRTPLLDPWVVAYAFQQPTEDRIGKAILKHAMRGIVPQPILERTDKKGFPAPFVAWAQEEPVRSFVKDRIGYVPDPSKPWDRGWWYDLLDQRWSTRGLRAA